ncbi:MAG: LPS assembly lipoprotein LptE [Acidobacteriota bacterium]
MKPAKLTMASRPIFFLIKTSFLKLKILLPTLLLLLTIGILACGYRIRSSVGSLPENMHSIGIPPFRNRTNEFKLEQLLTGAVIEEFNRRTRIPVRSSSADVDVVLIAEILSVNSSPVTFGSKSFGSAYMVQVDIGLKLVRLEDSKILWQNKKFTFRERYALNRDVRDFFSEENPAMTRLAHAFAESLVSMILESR